MSYGPNIMAMTSYLSTYQNVPFKRLRHLYETIFGLHISEGSVSNMLNAMRELSKTPYEMIRQKVAAGKVAGADESGVNVNGKNNWLWGFQNAVATYLAFDKSRSHDVINKHFSTMQAFPDDAWSLDMLEPCGTPSITGIRATSGQQRGRRGRTGWTSCSRGHLSTPTMMGRKLNRTNSRRAMPSTGTTSLPS